MSEPVNKLEPDIGAGSRSGGQAAPIETRNCIACGHQISKAAKVCNECGAHQEPWRNEVKYWAGVAGLITLIGSGLAFSFASTKAGIDYLWPAKPVISEANTFGKLSIVNMSNQNVWVKHLSIRSEKPRHDLRWDIGHVIEPHKLDESDLVILSKAQFAGLSRELFGQKQGTYANKIDAKTLAEILDNQHREKYVPVFLLQDGTEHGQVARVFGNSIGSVQCTADLTIVFAESQASHVLPIQCVGFIKNRIANETNNAI